MSKKTKKEIVVKLGAEAAEPVTPGDVNIFYGRDLIAGLSEDSTARLETENTIVVNDIGVEYTKPEPEAITIPVYTKVGDADPVFVHNYTGVPGDPFVADIRYPEGVELFSDIIWDTSDSVLWRYALVDPHILIDGYIPNIPEGATKVIIAFTAS